jgi:Spy/CpxP family protein refolding chaperone
MCGWLAAAAVGLVASASAFAFGAHGGRERLMKRVVTAVIDDALDEAKATQAQRETIYQARDHVLAAFDEHRTRRDTYREQALALFIADQIDEGRLAALRREADEEHRKIADAITQAFLDARNALTPSQRAVVADYVRSLRSHHRH